jgi:hypothetical protein
VCCRANLIHAEIDEDGNFSSFCCHSMAFEFSISCLGGERFHGFVVPLVGRLKRLCRVVNCLFSIANPVIWTGRQVVRPSDFPVE